MPMIAAVLIGGYHDFIGASSGTLKEMTDNGFEMAKTAVMDIALPLVGVMALWLGIMRLGVAKKMVRAVRKLHPDEAVS
jgi:spore maturation protein SpmA